MFKWMKGQSGKTDPSQGDLGKSPEPSSSPGKGKEPTAAKPAAKAGQSAPAKASAAKTGQPTATRPQPQSAPAAKASQSAPAKASAAKASQSAKPQPQSTPAAKASQSAPAKPAETTGPALAGGTVTRPKAIAPTRKGMTAKIPVIAKEVAVASQPTVCPACEEALHFIRYSGETIYQCETCNGYWCPGESLAVISKKPEGELDRKLFVKMKLLLENRIVEESDEKSRMKCPICQEPLSSSHYKKIVALTMQPCTKKCGVFVERSALEKIQIVEKMGVEG